MRKRFCLLPALARALLCACSKGQRQRGQQAESFTHNGSSVKNPIKFIIPQNFPLEHP